MRCRSTKRARLSGACALGCLSALLSGCGAAPEPIPPLIRLASLPTDASGSTPLDDVPAARNVGELRGDVRTKPLYVEDFDARAAGLGPRCEVAVRPRGDRALRCDGEGEIAVPVAPARFHRVAASLRATGPRCRAARLEIVEAGPQRRLRIHGVARVEPLAWHDIDRVLFTSHETERLELRLDAADCAAWLDDVRVEELLLTPEQELALIKGRLSERNPPGARPYVVRGRPLPVPDPETASPPRGDNYTIRDALFAPAPSDLIFDLRVPENAHLEALRALGYVK